MLAIFTSKDVHVNQELCFSYFGSVDDDEEQERVSSIAATFVTQFDDILSG